MTRRPKDAAGLLASTGFSAVGALVLQGAALLTLAPDEYGTFALAYAVFVFFLSGAQSVVVDVWLRARASHSPGLQNDVESSSSDDEFVGAAAGFAIVASAVILLFVLSIAGSAWLATSFATAAGSACFRMCLRARSMLEGQWLRVWPADLSTSVGFVAAAYILSEESGASWLEVVTASWMVASLSSVLLSFPGRMRPLGLKRWVVERWPSVRALYGEGLALDLSILALPLLAERILPAAGFASFRAASNALLPVRLILVPARPAIAASARTRGRRPSFWVLVLTCAVSAGAATQLLISYAATLHAVDGTVVELLGPLAAPIGLMAAGQVFSYAAYVICRVVCGGRTLAIARLLDSAVLLSVPLVLAWSHGASGAVWGLGVHLLISSVIWTIAMLGSRGVASDVTALNSPH